MNYTSINVRGLNNSPHQDELRNLILSNNISMVGLLETKVKENLAGSVARKINKNWSWHFNYGFHHYGRVWVGWNPNIWNLLLVNSSAQHIMYEATFLETNGKFIVTFIYAFNDGLDRQPLWDFLLEFSAVTNPVGTPWCTLGDFNTIASINEVLGGREH